MTDTAKPNYWPPQPGDVWQSYGTSLFVLENGVAYDPAEVFYQTDEWHAFYNLHLVYRRDAVPAPAPAARWVMKREGPIPANELVEGAWYGADISHGEVIAQARSDYGSGKALYIGSGWVIRSAIGAPEYRVLREYFPPVEPEPQYPKTWPPREGDAWQDTSGKVWFGKSNGSLSDVFTDGSGWPADMVWTDEGPLTLLAPTQTREEVQP